MARRHGTPRTPNDVDLHLVRLLTDFADRRFGPGWMAGADDFADRDRTVLQLAVPWSLYHVRVEGETILAHYLAEHAERLSASERACAAAQQAAWLSVWEVTGVEPGQGLALRDLLSGEERAVQERTASRSLVLRDAVLGRVVDFEGVSLLCGLYPRSLGPAEAAAVLRRVRAKRKLRGPVPIASLRDEAFGRALIRSWEEDLAAQVGRSARPADVRNTDGDVLLFTTDHFELAPGAHGEVAAKLAALPGVVPPDADEETPTYVFLRLGRRGRPSGDDTIVGSAALAERTLRVETNSRERADALRRRIEAACGARIRHRTREQADPLSAVARPGPEPGPPSPEATELALEAKRRHYREWLDIPVPALRGRTPRAAARSARGRAELDFLLRGMENREQRAPRGTRFDFSLLRRELGLDGGGEA